MWSFFQIKIKLRSLLNLNLLKFRSLRVNDFLHNLAQLKDDI